MSNLYAEFRRLLPNQPLQVGQVVAVAGGVATIELPGGGRIQARGDATTGQTVFCRDGVIEGEAPDLPIVAITI
ncbi:MAG TPA: hypothetical protein VGE36_04390 [Roseateles sp.]